MTRFVPSLSALSQFAPAAAGDAGGEKVPYGMTQWFRVRVDDQVTATPLGMWSSCGGLGVGFKAEEAPDGIGHDSPGIVPVALTYGKVVLERAVSKQDSARVRSWLESVVATWVLADEGGTAYAGATVTIELFSALQPAGGGMHVPVAVWELRDAYPDAWSGPTLNASSGGVATEKLTLVHGGFLQRGAGATAGAGGGSTGARGLLHLAFPPDGPAGELTLQYQPTEMSMDQALVYRNGDNTVVDTQRVTDPGKVSFNFTVRVEGRTAVFNARRKLYSWLENTPVSGQVGRATKGRSVADTIPKKLLLRVGTGQHSVRHEVFLKSVKTTFKRFTAQGVPSRATFALTLEVADPPPKPTNPTSGGPPGTTVHTLVQDDNLPRIAQDAYGSPARWREIAEENGIDDPLRLRVGRPLLLPGSLPR